MTMMTKTRETIMDEIEAGIRIEMTRPRVGNRVGLTGIIAPGTPGTTLGTIPGTTVLTVKTPDHHGTTGGKSLAKTGKAKLFFYNPLANFLFDLALLIRPRVGEITISGQTQSERPVAIAAIPRIQIAPGATRFPPGEGRAPIAVTGDAETLKLAKADDFPST